MIEAVHQWVPTFSERDAIGNHARLVRQCLLDQGLESEIIYEAAGRGVTEGIPQRRAPEPGPRSLGIYHLSIGSAMVDQLLARDETLLVDYHNLTPGHLLAPWDRRSAYAVEWGRRQMRDLASRAVGAMADSAFNEVELIEAGYEGTGVVPILLDTSAFERGVDEGVVDRVRSAGAVWLFVGRIAPNKCQHDVVLAFAAYRRLFDPGARLVLVGGVSSVAYERALVGLVGELGLEGAVVLTGSVSDEELGGYYAAADVFVCLSEHEGFCVPVVEAMFHRVPVVAFGAAAVPETVGGGGLVMGSKSPVSVASVVWRVVSDRGVRDGLVAAGTQRLGWFDLDRTRGVLMDFLRPHLERR